MDEKYFGLCIGGPLDGKAVAHPFRTLTVDMIPPVTPARVSDVKIPTARVHVGEFTYVHVAGFSIGYRPDINFWVPAKKIPNGLAWVVDQLVTSYIDNNRERSDADLVG